MPSLRDSGVGERRMINYSSNISGRQVFIYSYTKLFDLKYEIPKNNDM